jgi:hypothetical protein
MARRRPDQRVAHLLQLGRSPDEGGHAAARRQAGLLEPVEPVAPSARRPDEADGHQREPPLEGPGGGGAHQDRVPLGSRHQRLEHDIRLGRRRQIDHRALDRLSHETLARMNRDLRADAMGRADSRALDRLAHRNRRMRRPSRGVLDRLESESGNQAQRAERFDAATEALGLFDEDLRCPADLRSGVTFRRGDEGGPQERELPSLPGSRAPWRSRASVRHRVRTRAGHRRSRGGGRRPTPGEAELLDAIPEGAARHL